MAVDMGGHHTISISFDSVCSKLKLPLFNADVHNPDVMTSLGTQCRARYHVGCVPTQQAMCSPPPFGTVDATKRVAPPAGSNIAAAVEFSSTSSDVPGIVEDLIAILDSRGMDVEGVFRVPGNKDRINELLTQYWQDREKRLGVYTIKNVHDCSSALKQFLRDMYVEPQIHI